MKKQVGKTKFRTIGVRVPTEIYEEIERRALAQDLNVSQFFRRILKENLQDGNGAEKTQTA